VRRQPDDHRHEAPVAIGLRDVTLAVGRVRQPVQQDHGADGLSLRLQHVGAVPVVCEVRWIDRAPLEVPVDRDAVLRGQALGHLATNTIEQVVLRREIGLPVRAVELLRAELAGHVGMPAMQGQPAACRVDAKRQDRQRADADDDQRALQAPDQLSFALSVAAPWSGAPPGRQPDAP